VSPLEHPEIFRVVLESLPAGVYLVDRDRRIVFWNDGAQRITGYLRHDVVGRCCRDSLLDHCDSEGNLLCATACPLTETMRDGRPRDAQVYLRHRRGHRIAVQVHTVPVKDSHGAIIGAAESFDDQLAFSGRERRDNHLAAHGCLDSITGLPNRGYSHMHLRENLEAFAQFGIPFSVLCIQVDQLAHFTETHGREATDALLRVVSHSIRNTLRGTDFLGRWSEACFLAILPECEGEAVQKVGERIRRVVSCSSIQWWGDRLSITASLGSAAVKPGDTIESLCATAEHSLQTLEGSGSTSHP
jgi:diguanylate cyclase (GGDEF)-like protein/PAS domain S-box-containing protein